MAKGIIVPHRLWLEATLILFATPARSMVAAVICAIALAITPAPAVRAQAPLEDDRVAAQDEPVEPQVSLEYFRERLSPYGEWLDHPNWGEVWRPDQGDDFRPYFDGYWENTSDHGSLWISNEPFGDIVYHYGRWVFDRTDGWLWVPGYVWAPSWVVWRINNDYVGWLPMPPGYLDYQLLLTSPYLAYDWYGYRTFYGPIYGPVFVTEHYFTLWVFVRKDDLIYRSGVRHVSDIRKLRELYYGSTDCTRYVVADDRVVDHSINRGVWQRGGERLAQGRPARDFVRADARRVSVSRGSEIDRRHAERNREGRAAARQSAENRGAQEISEQRARAQDSPLVTRPERGRSNATTRDALADQRPLRAARSPNVPGATSARTPIANPAAESRAISNEPRADRSVTAPGARALTRPDRPSTDRQASGGTQRGVGAIATPRPPTALSGTATRPPRPITSIGSTTKPVTGTAMPTSGSSSPSTSSTSAPGASSAPAAAVPARGSARSSVTRSGIGGGARGAQGRGF
jgi:hypothetical protein